MFLSACMIGNFGESLAFDSKGPIKCLSLNNQSSQTRSTIVNVNSVKTLFCLFNVSANNIGGSCHIIIDPYARVCVPNKVKSMNVKVFNLLPWVNET